MTALPVIETLQGTCRRTSHERDFDHDGQIYWSPICFSPASGPPSTSGSASRASAATPRSSHEEQESAGGLRLDLPPSASSRHLPSSEPNWTGNAIAASTGLPHGRAAQAAAFEPMHVTDQVISIFAGTQGYSTLFRRISGAGRTRDAAFMREQKRSPHKIIETKD